MDILPHADTTATSNIGPATVYNAHSDVPPCYCDKCTELTKQATRRRRDILAELAKIEAAEAVAREMREVAK